MESGRNGTAATPLPFVSAVPMSSPALYAVTRAFATGLPPLVTFTENVESPSGNVEDDDAAIVRQLPLYMRSSGSPSSSSVICVQRLTPS